VRNQATWFFLLHGEKESRMSEFTWEITNLYTLRAEEELYLSIRSMHIITKDT
jgi:hypothetical protein